MYRHFFKRVIDIILGLFCLTVVSIPFIVITIILFFANNGKPFFFQKRPGKNNKLFRLMKFKTMNDRRDENGNLLPDAERMTKIGSFIRKTSLDELPQFINVIIGDMSLYGPRPLLEEYLPLYNETQIRRHEVRPGISGWAQVNGRNALSWQEKFELDVWYVDNLSFSLDFRLTIMTLSKVFKSEGINAEGEATTTFFQGNGTPQK